MISTTEITMPWKTGLMVHISPIRVEHTCIGLVPKMVATGNLTTMTKLELMSSLTCMMVDISTVVKVHMDATTIMKMV